MPGCGALTAAKIMGETALVTRFSSEAAFAQHAGLAPVPQWSGSTAGRMRRPKYGNRQLNSAIHRIAVTQLRLDGPGRVYYQKRLDAKDTRPWRFGHSNAGWAVRCTATCARIIVAANAAMGDPANNPQA